jgi:hypothetical protein
MTSLAVSGREGTSHLVTQWIGILEAGTGAMALPVRQLEIFVAALRVQRDQIRALQSQLVAFDEQLTALEQALQPLLEMGQQWTQAQSTMLGRLRDVTRHDTGDA